MRIHAARRGHGLSSAKETWSAPELGAWNRRIGVGFVLLGTWAPLTVCGIVNYDFPPIQGFTGSGPSGPPPPHFDTRFAVPPDHFGAHQISPQQQSFVDPNTGHIHHFAHPPPPPESDLSVTGLLSDVTSAFFGANRRLELGSGGTIVGKMRSALDALLYGAKVTSQRLEAPIQSGPPLSTEEVPEVKQYFLPGYPTPVLRRVKRQTSSIQGNIIRLLKVTKDFEPEYSFVQSFSPSPP